MNFFENVKANIIANLVVWLLVSSGSYLFGSHNGYIEGKNLGREEAFAEGERRATTIGKQAADAATEASIEQRVQERCEREQSDRLRAGFEQGKTAGQASCALEQYYSIFRNRIVEGATTVSNGEMDKTNITATARLIVEVRDIGKKALRGIADDVLNGLVDKLNEALITEDVDTIKNLLQQLASTLEAKDVLFRQRLQELARLQGAR
jgi:hypothetical protein